MAEKIMFLSEAYEIEGLLNKKDEKKAKPTPLIKRAVTMNGTLECSPSRAKRKSPTTLIDIPAEAMRLGSTLSESLPANGDESTMIAGAAISINPAACGLYPFMYCK